MKDIGPELTRIANSCDSAREDVFSGDVGSAVSQLAIAVADLAELVKRLHQSVSQKR